MNPMVSHSQKEFDMNLFKQTCVFGALVLAAVAVTPVEASSSYVRQYYGGWSSYRSTYYYRTYYYKPTYNYTGYQHHYVIYYPSRPSYYYYYNPSTKLYWGRAEISHCGEVKYSMLAEKDRKGTLSEIPEKAFPKAGAMPPIPESTDNTPIETPPTDKPGEDNLPKAEKDPKVEKDPSETKIEDK
jgi:hypothetical protein